MTISQVSAGRKNCLTFEVDGAEGSRWPGVGASRRTCGSATATGPTSSLPRDPGLLARLAPQSRDYPGGHAEGFPDTFKELYAAVYAAVAAGRTPAEPDYPTFADGHEEHRARRGDRPLERAEERWVPWTGGAV